MCICINSYSQCPLISDSHEFLKVLSGSLWNHSLGQQYHKLKSISWSVVLGGLEDLKSFCISYKHWNLSKNRNDVWGFFGRYVKNVYRTQLHLWFTSHCDFVNLCQLSPMNPFIIINVESCALLWVLYWYCMVDLCVVFVEV